MLFALGLLLLITASGFVITYFYDEDAPAFSRLCAGIIIGQVLFALAGFAFGCLVGMSSGGVVLSALASAAPLLLLLSRKEIKISARNDFRVFFESVKSFIKRPSPEQIAFAVIYAALTVLLWLFFERAMLSVDGGIGTGSSHNVGDISFHLQAIYGFLDGQNFPPQNPSFAGAKFTYPFMADLIAATLALTGAKISQAMFWQNMFLVIALVGLMSRFTFKLTSNKFAAQIAPLILLFSGGLGFLLFFSDVMKSETGVFNLLMKMPDNYTIRSEGGWRWGNSLTVLFMTQRSLLLGMPLALIILTKIWDFFSEKSEKFSFPKNFAGASFAFLPIFIVGLLAGTLPLVHAHSFAVVMGMSLCLALMSLKKIGEWATFFVAAAVIAIPELFWAMRNSASKPGNFVDWQFGWDSNNADVIFFWLKNTGFFIPLLLAAIVFLVVQSPKSKVQSPNDKNNHPPSDTRYLSLVLFWLPFALCFVVPNVFRLAPWIWDNIKVLIYWFTVSVPLVAWLLAQIWQRGKIEKAVVVVLLVGLTLAGWLDVWRIASRQMEYQVFNRDAVDLARQARQKLPPDAIVLSAPVYDSPAALMGRHWFLGYTAHVWSHGIDPGERETAVQKIYFGDPDADKLLSANNIGYIVISPQEARYTSVNENFLRRFPVVAQAGEYRLLQVK